MAKDLFERSLKENDNQTVKFTAGGGGSGKTELVQEGITQDFNGILFDGTLSKLEKANKKIDQVLREGKDVEIYGIMPRPESAWKFALKREISTGRGVPIDVFVDAHMGFVDTMIDLVKNRKDISLHLKDTRNVFEKRIAKEMPFISDDERSAMLKKLLDAKKAFGTREELIEKLKNTKLSEKAIRQSKIQKEIRRRKALKQAIELE